MPMYGRYERSARWTLLPVFALVVGLAAPAPAAHAAKAVGGVWKSTDQAKTFASVWPDRFPQATGATAATPDGTIYVGTGEANPGGGSITYEGDGVYRTTDGGAHRRRLTTTTAVRGRRPGVSG
jgi:hypothetical protein